MRLLLVEDEVSIRTALTAYLNQAGYVVDEADDGQEGSYFFAEFDYSVAIVDVGLPKLDGLSLIKSVRRNGNKTPILILTARDHWQEKVAGLDAGADDYVAKPFQIEEVLARLNALVRRAAGHASAEIVYGEFTLDGRQQCVSVSKMPLELTEFEYRLVEYFARHPGEVLSKSQLMDQLYGQDEDVDSNTIEVFMRRLRRKIDPNNTRKPFETLRGRGYRFCASAFEQRHSE